MGFMNTNKRLWAVIGGVTAIFFPGALVFGYPGIMSLYWQETYGVNQNAIGNCLFFVLVALGIFTFFVGKLQARLGTRVMVTIGSVICGIAVVFAANSTNIYLIYLWAFLIGVGSSFIYTPVLTTVQKWYPERRGLVSGVVNFSFGISAAIMSPIFNLLLKSQGYFWMNIEISIITIILGVIAAQFTEDPERSKFANQNKTKMNLAQVQTDLSFTVSECVRTKRFWFFWSTWAFQGAAGLSMITLALHFGISKGFSLTSSILILTSFNLTNGISRIITGYVSDIIGRNKTMSIAFSLSGIAYLLLPFTESLVTICFLVAVIGFAFGTLFSCSAPLVIDCFGLKYFGAIFGVLFTGYGFIAGIIGPSLSGYLIDSTKGNFVPVFIYLGLFSIISASLIYFVRPISKKMLQSNMDLNANM